MGGGAPDAAPPVRVVERGRAHAVIHVKLQQDLRRQGLALVFISHRFEEVFALCDTVTTMRDGSYVSTKKIADTTVDLLVAEMVGREVGELALYVLAETLAGSRPPAQLAPWTTERARSHIRKLGPLLSAGQQPLVQRVITSAPSAGVVEMSVVVGFGPRVRALAVRLERTQARPATAGRAASQQRWLCTAVEAA